MARKHSFFIYILLTLLFFWGCKMGGDEGGGEETADLSVELVLDDANGGASGSRTVFPDIGQGEIGRYVISLWKNGFEIYTQETYSPSYLFQISGTGTYNVTAYGYGKGAGAGSIIAYGEKTFMINSLRNAPAVNVTLMPYSKDLSGLGELRLKLQYPAEFVLAGVTLNDMSLAQVSTLPVNGGVLTGSSIRAGNYLIAFNFTRGQGGPQAGFFIEAVTIFPGMTSSLWMDSAGVKRDTRVFSQSDFAENNADALIIVKDETDPSNNITLLRQNNNYNISHENNITGSNNYCIYVYPLGSGGQSAAITSGAYTLDLIEAGSIVYKSSNISGSVFSDVSEKIVITVTANDRVSKKDYTIRMMPIAQVTRGQAIESYHTVLSEAFACASNNDMIVLLRDINAQNAFCGVSSNGAIEVTKNLAFTTVSNTPCVTIKRWGDNQNFPLFDIKNTGSFTINGNANSFLVLDGGAVWSGGTPVAASSVNNGYSAEKPLVNIENGEFKIFNRVILQNNGNNNSGGAIAANGGVVKISGADSEIRSNYSGQYGGAVFLDNGANFELAAGTIHHNKTNYEGGASSLKNSSVFTMSGGFIENNKAPMSDGGGIALNNASFNFQNGVISANEATGGGALATAGSSVINMTGGIIKNNNATTFMCGAIHISISSVLDMSGGLIKNNTAPQGVGVFVDGTIRMKGGAVIDASNSLFLYENTTIEVTGALYPENNAEEPAAHQSAAVIDLTNNSNHTDIETDTNRATGRTVLKSGGTYTLRQSDIDKFELNHSSLERRYLYLDESASPLTAKLGGRYWIKGDLNNFSTGDGRSLITPYNNPSAALSYFNNNQRGELIIDGAVNVPTSTVNSSNSTFAYIPQRPFKLSIIGSASNPKLYRDPGSNMDYSLLYIEDGAEITLKNGVEIARNNTGNNKVVQIKTGKLIFTDSAKVVNNAAGYAGIALASATNARIAIGGPLAAGERAVIQMFDTMLTAPAQPMEGHQVLELVSGAGTTIAAEHSKFSIIPYNGENWSIDVSGRLKKVPVPPDTLAVLVHNGSQIKEIYRTSGGYTSATVLQNAIASATTGGSASSPDIITLYTDIDMSAAVITAVAASFTSNKHIKLTVPEDISFMLKRTASSTSSFFKVLASASLTLEGNGTGDLILDGGAVWSGGTTPNPLPLGMSQADFPSPAFGANNVGITGNSSLITVDIGAFVMNAGAVLRNNAGGGGVTLYDATFTMSGGTISGISSGGTSGVYSTSSSVHSGNGSSILIAGGTISGNSSTYGNGGVYTNKQGDIFTMSGGIISGNKGIFGGVRISMYTSFAMTGGTITGNTATTAQGVYNTGGGFSMSGSAVVDANNDVYLYDNTTITITGDLTGTTPVATITLPSANYTVGRQVLTESGGSYLAANHAKFAVTPDATGQSWFIDSAGKLAQCVAARNYNTVPVYYYTLADAITASTGTSTSPDTITILRDIDINSTEISAIGNAFNNMNKHIKLTVPANTNHILKRTETGTEAFFIVTAGSSLTLAGNGTGKLILDGGALWSGGSTPSTLPLGMTQADFPSPAFGANNNTTGVGKTATTALVRVNGGGTFTMNNGAVLRNNENTGDDLGGGVFLSNNGTFTMPGGTITGNSAAKSSAGNGGGVNIDNGAGGNFTMSGTALITGNRAANYGGGLYNGNNNTQIRMSGGTISGNNSLTGGGGVFIDSNASFTMSGGTITGNNSQSTGGGVSILGNNASFAMSGGTITGNTSNGRGKGVYHDGINFSMSGGAVIDSNNYVYLPDTKTITITGRLTGTAPVATITPNSYTVGKQVLTESGGAYLAANHAKFAVTPQGQTLWTIDSAGRLALWYAAARNYYSSTYAPTYYATLADAISNSTGASAASPDTITILRDINIDSTEMLMIATLFDGGKHVKLTVPANTTYTLKRTENNSGAFLYVKMGNSLSLAGNGTGKLILDGGAVWSGGSTPNPLPSGMTQADFPSPAFGAANSGITAGGPLVQVNSYGSFTMTDGAVLRNNENTGGTNGGGVFLSNNGTFTMSGGKITGNSAANSTGNGGGVNIDNQGGLFTMSGTALITGNRANNYGGGLYLGYNSTQSAMSGGTISGNSALYAGGGVFISGIAAFSNNVMFAMSDGTISENSVQNGGGGGVYISGSFAMSGGTITGNTATNGKGVYHGGNGSFYMSNDAVVDSNNDVRLPNGKQITIAGSLSAASAAKITPQTYNITTQVLTTNANLTPANIAKFAVTPQRLGGPLVGEQLWSINNTGYLQSP